MGVVCEGESVYCICYPLLDPLVLRMPCPISAHDIELSLVRYSTIIYNLIITYHVLSK